MFTVTVPIPLHAEVLVQPGQKLLPDTVLCRLHQIGDLVRIHASEQLQIPAHKLTNYLKVQLNDSVVAGQVIAHVKALFGMIDDTVTALCDGVVESISTLDGVIEVRSLATRKTFLSYVSGQVKEVTKDSILIQTLGEPHQAAIGFGDKTYGLLVNRPDVITEEAYILIVKNAYELNQALTRNDKQCKGIICYQAPVESIKKLTRDSFPLVSMPVSLPSCVILDRFGNEPMPEDIYKSFITSLGNRATLFPQTQIRAGAIRPLVMVERLLG